MIAVWLVGPPSVVASATTSEASSPAVSTGARSSAHRIDGTSGTGTPGSGSPRSSAMTRSRMSRRSVTRSAISPPSWVNIVDELVDGAGHRAHRGVALADPLLGGARSRPGPARGSPSSASTSDAAPEACVGPLAQPLGDGRGGRGEPRHLARAGPASPSSAAPRRVVDGGPLARPDHRCVLHTADGGNALQDGSGSRRKSMGVTWSTMALM